MNRTFLTWTWPIECSRIYTWNHRYRYSKLLNIISNDFQNQSWRIKKISCFILFGNVIQYDAASEFGSESVANKIRIKKNITFVEFRNIPQTVGRYGIDFYGAFNSWTTPAGKNFNSCILKLAHLATKSKACLQSSYIFLTLEVTKNNIFGPLSVKLTAGQMLCTSYPGGIIVPWLLSHYCFS